MKLFNKPEPQPVEVAGYELRCAVCRHDLFWSRNASLTSSVAAFFGLDWTRRSATCFVCARCTHIAWFLGE